LYAIIESGGKQYRVSEGDLIDLERVQGEIGQPVNFDRVLLVGDENSTHLGTPLVTEGQVVGTIAEHGKQDKVMVFKFKRRKGYRRRRGHRQLVTTVRIEKIALEGHAKPQVDVKPPAEQPPKADKKETVEKLQKATAQQTEVAKKKTTKTAAKKKASTKKTVKKKTAAVTKPKTTASKKTTSKKKTTKVTKKTTKDKDNGT